MKTQIDIDKSKAENDMREFIIRIYKHYPNLTPIDICNIISSRLVSETDLIATHYKLVAKDSK